MIRLLLGVMMMLAVSTDASHAQAAAPSGLERVRRIYGEALTAESAIARGLAEIERLRAGPAGRHAETAAALTAYRGAFTVLRAKHGFWPPDRLRHTRNGLAVLDSVVAAHPAHAEARYLRLMSAYYLPGLFGRGWSVRDDFAALARLLPSVRTHYPAELYGAIVRFVLRNGQPTPEQRAALEASLQAALASG
jgi:hypothetical protein